MASLLNIQTNDRINIRANHTFGRNTDSNITILNNPDASRNHATVVWNGEMWQIKDSSSNGTFVNNKRLVTGVYQSLSESSIIQFGNLSNETWRVIDLAPPVTCLMPLDDSLPVIILHDVEVLPVDGPEILLYLSENDTWICESSDEPAVLKSGDKVGRNGMYWQFVDAHPCAETATMDASPPPSNIEFKFTANQNEEHVSLKLVVDNNEIDLGERNHHYLLLLLARQRLKDEQNGLMSSEQGWIKKDILIKMVGLIEQHINIHIHRFRRQVASALPGSTMLHQIVERRPGEIRIAYTKMSIKGGFNIENKAQAQEA